jgi:hypothetical protein
MNGVCLLRGTSCLQTDRSSFVLKTLIRYNIGLTSSLKKLLTLKPTEYTQSIRNITYSLTNSYVFCSFRSLATTHLSLKENTIM